MFPRVTPGTRLRIISCECSHLRLNLTVAISGGQRSTGTQRTTANPGPCSGLRRRRRNSSSPAATWSTGWSSPGRNSLGRMEIRDTRTVPSLSRPAQTVISPTKVIIFPLPPGLDCSDCSKDVPQESSPLGSPGPCQRLWRICESIGVFRGFYDL